MGNNLTTGIPERTSGGASSPSGTGGTALPEKAAVSRKGLGRKIRELRLSVKISLSIVIVLFFAALFAEWVAPYDPYKTNLRARNQPPTIQHVLGTDQIGRDTLSRCIYGLRTSVGISLLGVFFGTILGASLGIWAGLMGGWADRIISAIIDFQYAVPSLLVILVGISLLGTDTWVLIVLISFARWHGTARLVRGQVMSLRVVPSVEAAVALGSTSFRVATRHILPNLTSVLVVNMTLKFPGLLLLESSLSFLGLGVQPPVASLGRMVAEGRDYLINMPWVTLAPALVIVVISMCFQIIGDWLRDVVDVRERD
jgi:peptide/nickel transport system permease protein